jgi:hypothetical protein
VSACGLPGLPPEFEPLIALSIREQVLLYQQVRPPMPVPRRRAAKADPRSVMMMMMLLLLMMMMMMMMVVIIMPPRAKQIKYPAAIERS